MLGPLRNLTLRKSLIDTTSPLNISVHKLGAPDHVKKLFDM